MILVEKELEKIDLYLKKLDINLMITFDQLDYIVTPNLWDKIVAPLINYCRSFPYLKIQPKIFVRRDLFNKLSNLTNKNALKSKQIDLEWSKDEIFAFFFKVTFANAKKEFFEIMKIYETYSKHINNIEKIIDNPNNYNQIDLNEFYLKILVETFFGKYAHFMGDEHIEASKYGLTYDWFYESLADANGTISLRVFLDLIKSAIDEFKKDEYGEENYFKPILRTYLYTNQKVRNDAVENYVNDLANEVGNEDFKLIINHIKDPNKYDKKFRLRNLVGHKYYEFLEHIKNNLKLNKNKEEDIERTLVVNGVISISYIKNDIKKCTFAYLYKYYLGLRG